MLVYFGRVVFLGEVVKIAKQASRSIETPNPSPLTLGSHPRLSRSHPLMHSLTIRTKNSKTKEASYITYFLIPILYTAKSIVTKPLLQKNYKK
jgi:hypothetical protein